MKSYGRKIAGVLILCAAVIEMICGFADKELSTILMGIVFVIIGTLYLLEKQK